MLPILLFLALHAGASVDMDQGHATPPADWPALEVVERLVLHAEMRERCTRYVRWPYTPVSCAEMYFGSQQCVIWLSEALPREPRVIAHERLHCAGHDHEGSTELADAWRRWQQQSAARAAAEAMAGTNLKIP